MPTESPVCTPKRERSHRATALLPVAAVLRSPALRLLVAVIALVGALALASGVAYAEPGGEVVAFGKDGEGELGVGFTTLIEEGPDTMPGLTHVVQIAEGFEFGLALLSNGTVESWGENSMGQLGDGRGRTEKLLTATPISGLSNVSAIAAAGAHGMALKEGTVWTWGNTQSGEEGNGVSGTAETSEEELPTAKFTPVKVEGLSGVAAIAAGGASDYALLSSGEIEAWGENNDGQLGFNNDRNGGGGTECYPEFAKVHGVPCSTKPEYVLKSGEHLKGVAALAVGEESAYATLSGGKLLDWGNDGKGELGTGEEKTTGYHPVPTEIMSEVEQVGPGNHHVLVIAKGKKIYGFGAAGSGDLVGSGETELCQGTTPCYRKPTEITAFGSPSSVTGGKADSFIIEAGKVYAFGENAYGELGVGSEEEVISTPTLVKGIGAVTSVSASEVRTMALLEEGVSAPALTLEAIAEVEALTAKWTFTEAEGYKVRACPESGQGLTPEEEKCTSLVSLSSSTYSYKWNGLKPGIRYELIIKPHSGGSRHDRHIIGTPLP
jgi:alpha-tubulin suppressor-like RCC1 family protein